MSEPLSALNYRPVEKDWRPEPEDAVLVTCYTDTLWPAVVMEVLCEHRIRIAPLGRAHWTGKPDRVKTLAMLQGAAELCRVLGLRESEDEPKPTPKPKRIAAKSKTKSARKVTAR